MDVSMIQTLITSVGFPIACVIALGWFIFKFYTDYTQQSAKRENELMNFIKEEQAQMQGLVATNAEFVEILNSYKTDIEEITHDVNDIKTELQGKEQ